MRYQKLLAVGLCAATVGVVIAPQTALAASTATPGHGRVVQELSAVPGLLPAPGPTRSASAQAGDVTAPGSIALRGASGTAAVVGAGVTATTDALPATDAATITGATDASYVFVLRDGTANPNVSYTVSAPNHRLITDPAGGIMVVDNATNKFDSRISAPWAYDATGKSLPTSFTISGDIVTQHVDTTHAVFPVVADPKYTWGWVTGTIYFNKVETIKAAASAAFFAAVAAFAPPPFDVYLVASAGWFSLVAGWAAADGKCLKLKIDPPLVFPYEYSGGYCT